MHTETDDLDVTVVRNLCRKGRTLMNIEERRRIRTCQNCKKEYEDTQTFINGVPSFKFAICNNCMLAMVKNLRREENHE